MAKKKKVSAINEVKRLNSPRAAKSPTESVSEAGGQRPTARTLWRKAVDEAKRLIKEDMKGNPRLFVVKTNPRTNEVMCQAVSEIMDEPGNTTVFMVDCDTDA